ncbi:MULTISPECIES: TetR/AcrR family transcriptional regulator [unclassified Streptomyces]|uniref:TetR/AcrR family transcriptional regulator n=1 Tax=unclassified Streptomyces TaxID=2593676 RepID=UPI001F0382C2|nr:MULTISPECIES: TetR/AcrR family transcriptional regulator [unclassified Streptomyces]MCH0565200.1 TetR/AcrR family transcriptional regulator [Streptomyces sp. MUM 2J]MCH0568283.1 TetR/AcrR family transcriptional regulator [Streptomyces sp. MUM 136J]
MAPTSQETGRETRARLLRAAAELIVEDGWGTVSTRRVADRAGVRPGLVHYHFQSVDNLLVEAALQALRQEVDGLLSVLRGGADTGTGLEFFLELVARYAADSETTALFSEALLAATRNERLRLELAAALGECRSALTGWLTAQTGDPEAEAVAVLLLALLDGLVLHHLIDPRLGGVPLEGALRRLAGLDGPPRAGDGDGSPRRHT